MKDILSHEKQVRWDNINSLLNEHDEIIRELKSEQSSIAAETFAQFLTIGEWELDDCGSTISPKNRDAEKSLEMILSTASRMSYHDSFVIVDNNNFYIYGQVNDGRVILDFLSRKIPDINGTIDSFRQLKINIDLSAWKKYQITKQLKEANSNLKKHKEKIIMLEKQLTSLSGSSMIEP